MKKLMSESVLRSLRTVFGVTMVAITAAGCASIGTPQTPEMVVKERASLRWQALIKNDMEAAYGFTTPAYRAVATVTDYRQRMGSAVRWSGVEVVGVRCPDATKCIANVRIEAKPYLGRRFGDSIVTHVEETWLLQENQWWLFQKL